MNRAVSSILGTISGLLLIYGALCLSLVSGYSAEGSCVGVPVGMCPPNAVADKVTVSLLSNISPLMFALPLLLLAFVIGAPVWIGKVIRLGRRGLSAQTTIMIVSLLASALLMVDVFILLPQMPQLSATQVCLSASTGPAIICLGGRQGLLLDLAGVGWAPLAGAIIAGAPAWVMTLTQTARWRQWRWFVAALLFSPVAATAYALFSARSVRPPSRRPPVESRRTSRDEPIEHRVRG